MEDMLLDQAQGIVYDLTLWNNEKFSESLY